MTAKIGEAQSSSNFSSPPEPEMENASAPLSLVLADVEAGAICWKSFSAFEATMQVAEFRDFLASYLVDVELHLEQIARLRARQDFSAVAWEARCIAI